MNIVLARTGVPPPRCGVEGAGDFAVDPDDEPSLERAAFESDFGADVSDAVELSHTIRFEITRGMARSRARR
jgi:hypothetical protein